MILRCCGQEDLDDESSSGNDMISADHDMVSGLILYNVCYGEARRGCSRRVRVRIFLDFCIFALDPRVFLLHRRPSSLHTSHNYPQ